MKGAAARVANGGGESLLADDGAKARTPTIAEWYLIHDALAAIACVPGEELLLALFLRAP